MNEYIQTALTHMVVVFSTLASNLSAVLSGELSVMGLIKLIPEESLNVLLALMLFVIVPCTALLGL